MRKKEGKIWVKKLSRRGAEIAEKVKQKVKMKTIFSHEGTSERSDKTGRVANRNKARRKRTVAFKQIEILFN
jgi:hypothetical protein